MIARSVRAVKGENEKKEGYFTLRGAPALRFPWSAGQAFDAPH
jgi:hypothetical protein